MSDLDDDQLLGLLDENEEEKPVEPAGEDGSNKDEGSDADAADDEEEEDEEEEDESEEEDDDDEPSSKRRRTEDGDKKKKKRKGASRFLDDAAESGSEDDDDMAADEEVDMEEEQAAIAEIDNYQRHEEMGQDWGDKSEEQIAAELEAKHRKDRAAERAQKEEVRRMGGAAAMMAQSGDGSARFGANFLPRPEDPKVFAVKCRPNCAKQTVARLINKCYAYRVGKNHEQKRMDLGIISAFSLDHVKEWFYVESHRQLFVENAVNGLENVFRYRIVPVEASELMQLIMNTGKPKESPKVGDLARLRQHPYRNDLCQILKVTDGGNRVLVRCVPRVDFVNKTYVKIPRKQQQIHPQRFFVRDLALGTGHGHDGEGSCTWGELRIDREGYLVQELSSRAIMFGSKFVKPSLEDINFFMKSDKDRVARAAGFSSLTETQVEFNLGDTARVARGQLEGAVGKIVDISPKDGLATLLWQVPGQQPLESRVELIDCSKYFPDGCQIQVASGPKEGTSGLVLAMVGDNVVFLNDMTQREDEARANDCRQTSIKPKERHTQGSFNLYDLVQLTDQTVGVLTRLGNSDMTLLTDSNTSKTVPVATIKHTLRGKADCPDFYGNMLRTRSAVKIMPSAPSKMRGQYNRIGECLQIYKDTAFVRVDAAGKDSVVAALNGKQVALLGGKNKIGGLHQPRKEPAQPTYKNPVYFAAQPQNLSTNYAGNSVQWNQPTQEYPMQ